MAKKYRITPPPAIPSLPLFSLPMGSVNYDNLELDILYSGSIISNPYTIDWTNENRIKYPNIVSWDFVLQNNQDVSCTLTNLTFVNCSNHTPGYVDVGVTINAGESRTLTIASTSTPASGLKRYTAIFTLENLFSGDTGSEIHKIYINYLTIRNENLAKNNGYQEGRIAPNVYADQYTLDINTYRKQKSGFDSKN